ncbi:uncharacterized protein LOC123579874 isoform X2 [Leopardus geoffroyi]|uniref:uncharacterized protein LOC123579874 isoform X2 n=1 Tax=Leopardus geoffroyi TaxID=46844 RepID=UPI001E25F4C3|nr:uncharacterized protein LOC123579874 isoform X2 [Leopardus geoffroyi]
MDAQESVAGPCGRGRLFLRAAPRGGCSSWRSHRQRFFPLELAKPWTFWAVNAVPSCPAALPSGVANTCSLCRSWFQAAGGPQSPESTVFSRRMRTHTRHEPNLCAAAGTSHTVSTTAGCRGGRWQVQRRRCADRVRASPPQGLKLSRRPSPGNTRHRAVSSGFVLPARQQSLTDHEQSLPSLVAELSAAAKQKLAGLNEDPLISRRASVRESGPRELGCLAQGLSRGCGRDVGRGPGHLQAGRGLEGPQVGPLAPSGRAAPGPRPMDSPGAGPPGASRPGGHRAAA